MKIFISGGCKNGKSYYAQHLAKHQQNMGQGENLAKHQQSMGLGALYYIATMDSTDHEDDERIKRHKSEREGWGFVTVEQKQNIERVLDLCDHGGSFLLDSLTALLANEMFAAKGAIHTKAFDKIAEGILAIMSCIDNIVIVSDYIYSDAILYDPLTEIYRKSLAKLDLLAVKHCDVVIEVCYTQIIVHKGREVFNAAFEGGF